MLLGAAGALFSMLGAGYLAFTPGLRPLMRGQSTLTLAPALPRVELPPSTALAEEI